MKTQKNAINKCSLLCVIYEATSLVVCDCINYYVELWMRNETNRVYYLIGSDGVFITADRLDYFIVGVTNTSSAVSAPVRGSYPLCGQYPSTASTGERMIQYCSAATPPGEYVIIQQPVTGVGSMTICELEVYGELILRYTHSRIKEGLAVDARSYTAILNGE